MPIYNELKLAKELIKFPSITPVDAGIIKFLSNRLMVGIGLISYSLYLWHHPILSFDKILNISNGDILIKICLIVLALILAICTYFFVEKPFRQKKFYSTKKLIITLSISIFLCLNWCVIERYG